MADALAVVPIFVNVGAALGPAILATIASVAALLFKPRQLARACRRRPVTALLVLAGVGAGLLGGNLLWARQNALAGPRTTGGGRQGRTDWAMVAMDIIRREQAPLAGAPVGTMPAPSRSRAAIVLGRGFDRCGYDGGPVPLGLRCLWEHRQEDTMFLSSPAVVAAGSGGSAGRVFAATCQIDVTGKYGSVVCLDAATGRRLWQTSTMPPSGGGAAQGGGAAEEEDLKAFFSSPAVTADGKYLVIGQGLHADKDCSLICLDAETGKVRWRVPTPLHIEGSPAIRGDLAVAGAGAIEGADRKPQGDAGFVLAVRISDGAVLWRHALPDPESSPAIAEDGTVYIGSGFGGSAVVALRGQSDDELRSRKLDRVLWRTPAPYPVTGAVTLAGDCVIVGAGNADYVFANPRPAGVVMALDRHTGKVRWQTATDDAVLGAVAARDGRAICPVRNGEVVALDLTDGRPIWRRRVSGKAPILAGTAFTGRWVYAVSRDGYLAVIDAEDGKLIEKHYLNDEASPGELGLTLSSPTIAGGRLFVGSETGGLRCCVGTR